MNAPGRLALPQVTLVAIDTRSPALALQALQRSMQQADFARVVLFTHGSAVPARPPGVECVDCGPIRSGAEYSHFVLRRLAAHVQTSHALVTQWDGFVVDARAWDPAFLDFDYIGAPWPEQPQERQVGNGGFSLRTRRMLQAGCDPRIETEHPEDIALCRQYGALLQREHGIRFAPPALARRFSFENGPPSGPTFGFHGPYNLPRFVDEEALAAMLGELPDEFFRSRDARRLARALLRQGMPDTVLLLQRRRLAAGRADWPTRLLALAAAAHRLARRTAFAAPGSR